MLLKERVMDPRAKDDISEALSVTVPSEREGGQPYRDVPSYAFHYYPNGPAGQQLRERTVGPHSRQLVGFTRFYPTLTPKVIIDFEPAPPTPFFEQEKRQWCIEQGIVYVPIHLNARYDETAFKELVEACRKVLATGANIVAENRALGQVTTVEEWLQAPELTALIDARVLEMLDEDQRTTGKCYRGVAKTHMLRKFKEQEIKALRGELKSGRIVDPRERYRQPAAQAE